MQKGIEKGTKQIKTLGGLLNREQSDRALDLEEDFIKELPANSSFTDGVQIIFPGTLWCGGGDKAKSDDDLGRLKDTDACCRDHDKCKDNILAGEEKYGLENSGLFTRYVTS